MKVLLSLIVIVCLPAITHGAIYYWVAGADGEVLDSIQYTSDSTFATHAASIPNSYEAFEWQDSGTMTIGYALIETSRAIVEDVCEAVFPSLDKTEVEWILFTGRFYSQQPSIDPDDPLDFLKDPGDGESVDTTWSELKKKYGV